MTRITSAQFSTAHATNAIALEPVAQLEATANRWVPNSATRKPVVDRKVRSLLNKLTMEKYESISKIKNGCTLIQVIRLVLFEKAMDETTWSEMYARLCRKMMKQISPDVQDDGIPNEDQALKIESERNENKESGGTPKFSEEYYVIQKAKRQGLGSMLTDRIMHWCIRNLLSNINNPEEEEIESLCKLLSISHMKKLAKSSNVSSRVQFMLPVCLFVFILSFFPFTYIRGRIQLSCESVMDVAAPTTITQIHEAVCCDLLSA
ncbi:armadillo-type protein [Phellopilus nigrolimitatus]|nr:armadillo-type protein [Phellopilus nigrolimitatus]